MRTHQDIDRRSLALARAVVAKVEADPGRRGLARAIVTCRRWSEEGVPAAKEWMQILETRDWAGIRGVLLDPAEEGCRLRQSSPFAGVLPPRERWAIYREFSHEPESV